VHIYSEKPPRDPRISPIGAESLKSVESAPQSGEKAAHSIEMGEFSAREASLYEKSSAAAAADIDDDAVTQLHSKPDLVVDPALAWQTRGRILRTLALLVALVATLSYVPTVTATATAVSFDAARGCFAGTAAASIEAYQLVSFALFAVSAALALAATATCATATAAATCAVLVRYALFFTRRNWVIFGCVLAASAAEFLVAPKSLWFAALILTVNPGVAAAWDLMLLSGGRLRGALRWLWRLQFALFLASFACDYGLARIRAARCEVDPGNTENSGSRGGAGDAELVQGLALRLAVAVSNGARLIHAVKWMRLFGVKVIDPVFPSVAFSPPRDRLVRWG
jgi:hypothetical protein